MEASKVDFALVEEKVQAVFDFVKGRPHSDWHDYLLIRFRFAEPMTEDEAEARFDASFCNGIHCPEHDWHRCDCKVLHTATLSYSSYEAVLSIVPGDESFKDGADSYFEFQTEAEFGEPGYNEEIFALWKKIAGDVEVEFAELPR